MKSKPFLYRLKKERKRLGLTQEEFAMKHDLSHAYLKKIESGHAKPGMQWIYDLAKKLKIDFETFKGPNI